MYFFSVIKCLGGVGLFLYGMSLMGSMLEKLAGSGLTKVLENLTTSRRRGVGAIKGWGLGLVVTGIIQSSAATTLILIGFVNAGIMNLVQAIPVVFGANVGSTMTAQLLRLGDLGAGSKFLSLLKPSAFAPILIGIGALMFFRMKKQRTKDLGCIFLGLGILFFGMTIMEEVFSPLKDSESFQKLFTSFSNPILGILTGLALTAVIQSSSASVGILQALSATGSITYGIAIPIIIGQNIGKCMPIILGAIGADKKAKKVSLSYVLFNIIGAVLFSAVIYGVAYTVGLPMLEKTVNRGNIANVHLTFNLVTSLILLPFAGQMEKLADMIVREKKVEEPEEDAEIRKLEDIFLATPGLALRQCTGLIRSMGERLRENYKLANGLLSGYDQAAFDRLEKNEGFIDRCETALSAYIVRIDRKRLTPDNKREMMEILNSIGDFERMGDYCMKIAWAARHMQEKDIVFSDSGKQEIRYISEACGYVLDTVLDAFINDDLSCAVKIEPAADTIEEMEQLIRSRHVERLRAGDCGAEGGAVLYELVSAYERIAGHASNVSLHVAKRISGDRSFDDMHGHASDRNQEEYQALELYYRNRFLEPVQKMTVAHPADEEPDEKEDKKQAENKQEKDNKNKDSRDKDRAKAKDTKETKETKDEKAKEVKEEKNKEAKAKEGKEKEGKEKEAKKKDEKSKEGKPKDSKESRDKDSKEKENKDKENKDKVSKDKVSKDKENKDKENKEKDSKNKDSKEKDSKEKESKEKDNKEKNSKDKESKDGKDTKENKSAGNKKKDKPGESDGQKE